jgi:P27 family predicted phage terminase small subunit
MPQKPPLPPPDPPAHLSESSRELWRSVVKDHRDQDPSRTALVQVALEALDRAEQASAVLKVEGLTATTATTGAVHVHPAVKVERDSQALFVRIWLQLGFGL